MWSYVLLPTVSHAKNPPGFPPACFSKGMDSIADFADLLLPFVKIRHGIKTNNPLCQTGVFKEGIEFRENWRLNSFSGGFENFSNFCAKN